MKIWALIKNDHRIVRDVVEEVSFQKTSDIGDWNALIGEMAKALDLSRPVILNSHISDLKRFSRVTFKPSDFIEPVDFDQFEIEIFSLKNK